MQGNARCTPAAGAGAVRCGLAAPLTGGPVSATLPGSGNATGPSRQAMSVFFTSDSHFGHAGARGLYRRPFASVAEMDRQMIDRWNAAVRPADEVWHLGDFAVRQSPERVADLLTTLHGTKHLIVGNNDGSAVTDCAGWRSVERCTRRSRSMAGSSRSATIPSAPGATWAKARSTCTDTVMADSGHCEASSTSVWTCGISGRFGWRRWSGPAGGMAARTPAVMAHHDALQVVAAGRLSG